MYLITSLILLILDTEFVFSEENNDCIPQMVDSCFYGYFNKILKVRNKTNNLKIEALCSDTLDRLNCAKEVLNSDCNKINGKENFDNWMEGMISVYQYLCDLSPESLRALWQSTDHGIPCWNMENYLNCIEVKTKITHIVDMLSVRLDVNECNWILIALSSCSSRSTAKNDECLVTQNVLDEILHLFVQKSKCSHICSNASKEFNLNIITLFLIILFINLNVFKI